jgi:hypothetical protein
MPPPGPPAPGMPLRGPPGPLPMPGGPPGAALMRRPGGVSVAKATTVYVGKIATSVPDAIIRRLLEACGRVRAARVEGGGWEGRTVAAAAAAGMPEEQGSSSSSGAQQ